MLGVSDALLSDACSRPGEPAQRCAFKNCKICMAMCCQQYFELSCPSTRVSIAVRPSPQSVATQASAEASQASAEHEHAGYLLQDYLQHSAKVESDAEKQQYPIISQPTELPEIKENPSHASGGQPVHGMPTLHCQFQGEPTPSFVCLTVSSLKTLQQSNACWQVVSEWI